MRIALPARRLRVPADLLPGAPCAMCAVASRRAGRLRPTGVGPSDFVIHKGQ
nr:MAG TPA: deoxycytidylate deaminase [Caudoviricetes sp.]